MKLLTLTALALPLVAAACTHTNKAGTGEELIETITHLAFYAGWPSAMTAIGVAKEVFEGK